MKVRQEIEKYADEAEKPILLWLLERYHWESEWRQMADCTFKGRFPSAVRVWSPSRTGLILYYWAQLTGIDTTSEPFEAEIAARKLFEQISSHSNEAPSATEGI